jgi:hypothetical protein
MGTSKTFHGTNYTVPASGEVNWPSLSSFLIALADYTAVNDTKKQTSRVATTSPVTVSDTTDCVVLTNLSVAGAVTVNLPAGTDGRWFVIADQKGDAGTNNITINRNGTETINGATTYVISENNGGVILVYSATNTRWNVVGRYFSGSVMTNPLTTTGDTIYSSSGTTPARLAIGTNGQRLKAGSSTPAWGWKGLGAKSANYTITDTDGFDTILVTTSSSTITITLPAAANNTGRELTIKKADSGSGKITITRAGSDTIDGYTTTDIGDGAANQYSYLSLISDGTNWYVTACGGERKVNTGSGVAFNATSGHWADVCNVSLPAGDWLVDGVVQFHLGTATTFTNPRIGISTTSGDFGTGLTSGDNMLEYTPPVSSSDTSGTIAGHRVTLTSAQPVYLKVLANFASLGTATATGRISARRIR